jgi:hypothetical protein
LIAIRRKHPALFGCWQYGADVVIGGRTQRPAKTARFERWYWEVLMLAGAEARARLQAILDDAVKGMSDRATGAATSAPQRLAAIEGLMRVVEGPKKRPSDPSDEARGCDARAALSRAAPFLQQMATSHTTARVRARAAKLVIRISQFGPAPVETVKDHAAVATSP